MLQSYHRSKGARAGGCVQRKGQGQYQCKLARQREAFVTLYTLPTTPALLDAISVLGTFGMQ